MYLALFLLETVHVCAALWQKNTVAFPGTAGRIETAGLILTMAKSLVFQSFLAICTRFYSEQIVFRHF